MNLIELLPFVTGVVLVILTVDVFRRYLRHHGTHTYTLIWGIGLAMFTLATLSEAVLGLSWNTWAFRTWYLMGAILSAAWIGQGTVHLLVRNGWARILLGVLILASVAATVLLLGTPVNAQAFQVGRPIADQYRNILPEGAPVRLTTIPFNIYGTISLVGGALWSGYLFWRKRVLPNRVLGNVLIAAGALSIASASSLARLGNGEFLALGQLLFALLIYVGFMLASRPAAEEVPQTGAARAAQAD